eukprot:jgi/Mesvir1/23170/Mv22643-RA.1
MISSCCRGHSRSTRLTSWSLPASRIKARLALVTLVVAILSSLFLVECAQKLTSSGLVLLPEDSAPPAHRLASPRRNLLTVGNIDVDLGFVGGDEQEDLVDNDNAAEDAEWELVRNRLQASSAPTPVDEQEEFDEANARVPGGSSPGDDDDAATDGMLAALLHTTGDTNLDLFPGLLRVEPSSLPLPDPARDAELAAVRAAAAAAADEEQAMALAGARTAWRNSLNAAVRGGASAVSRFVSGVTVASMPTARFLLVLRVKEGLVNGKAALLDLIVLAKQTGRILVEPLMAEAQFRHPCSLGGAAPGSAPVDARPWDPMGSYFDLSQLVGAGVPLMRYADFVKLLPEAHGKAMVMADDKMPLACSRGIVRTLGLQLGGLPADLRTLAESPEPVVAVYGYAKQSLWGGRPLAREAVDKYHPLLGTRGFSPQMHALVAEIKRVLGMGNKPYLGVHWRTEVDLRHDGVACLYGVTGWDGVTPCLQHVVEPLARKLRKMGAGRGDGAMRLWLGSEADPLLGSPTYPPKLRNMMLPLAQLLQAALPPKSSVLSLASLGLLPKDQLSPPLLAFLLAPPEHQRTIAALVDALMLASSAEFVPVSSFGAWISFIKAQRQAIQKKRTRKEAGPNWDYWALDIYPPVPNA